MAGFAADITVRTAGAKGNFATFVLDSDIPALLRKGAPEALGGRLHFSEDTLTLGPEGRKFPSK